MIDYSKLDSTYVIKERIGSGTGGIVYKAYHKRLQKYVVLKQMKGDTSQINIRTETDILKNLKSPYLPQVLDLLKYGNEVFTVMEYIEGESLQYYLNEGVKFRQKLVIKWMLQLTEALEVLHSQFPPIIHGDIKPANIMLTPQGDVCLIDFNISGTLDGDKANIVGYTNSFASPEQIIVCEAKSKKQKAPVAIDVRTDLYSLGATFCCLLTGEKTCAKDRTEERLKAVIPRLSDALIYILMRLTASKADDRYKNAKSLKGAIRGIRKADYRYKSLVIRQTACLLLVASMAIGGSLLAVYGHFRMQDEKMERYIAIVDDMKKAWEEGTSTEAKKLYEQAAALYPGRYEAYLEYARWLYEEKEYKEDIDFIEKEVLKKLDDLEDSGELYYILANCYAELEEYEFAVEAYANAVAVQSDYGLYYSDYAIALARLGRIEYAKKRLNRAIKLGIKDDKIYYARGEVNYADGQYEQALTDFLTCIDTTDEVHMSRRAYLMAAKIYLRNTDEQNCQNCIDLMKKAQAQLPVDSTPGILEYLAQAYMSMAVVTQEEEYDARALEVLRNIIDMGWGNYITHQNIAVLYQKRKQWDLALQELNWMLDKYGEDYRIYKKMALIEASVQEQKTREARDYSQFKIYYDKAVKLYQNRKDASQADTEMQILENLHDQAKSGGWLQ